MAALAGPSGEELGKALLQQALAFCCGWRGEWASLTFSLLAYQMPVAKRPRKSSSDLDQGSPSLTEEENSETSSESEKNSDQVRGFWDTLVWRLSGQRGKGWRKSIAICRGNGLREPDWLLKPL